jgi:Domain of unknown function (DUF5668)
MRIVGPIILIVIGVLFLLGNLGMVPVKEVFRTWWPLILIVVGLGLLVARNQRRP